MRPIVDMVVYRAFDWHYRAPYGTIGCLGMRPIYDHVHYRAHSQTPDSGHGRIGHGTDLLAHTALRTCCVCSWHPITGLSTLFSGTPERVIGRLAWHPKVVSEEALYMELLAAEHSDKALDASTLEGSGDDYEAQFSYYHIGN
ncbi:hypothetical protein GGX14DRAFT_406647 [Mycena pura]|uniref:Uncharacterized protein n=1 Tax=Mycena pura TaxID=153505 RepID=A0AAD6XY14_9AGAR|nr:hypothetical protein GGX14DRAFT_406647 [Mycena pura]